MPDSTFLTRVTLTNYKSIAHCDVQMRPLMFLVGANGAGKSNFLDALRFVSDALNTSLDYAVRQRNGFFGVYCRSTEYTGYFSIRLEFKLSTGAIGYYAFRIEALGALRYIVQSEECHIHPINNETEETYFSMDHGTVITSEAVVPIATRDRLYLVALSGIAAFRPVYEAFSRMAFYNLNPEQIRDFQTPSADELLTRDGDNIASILIRMLEYSPDTVHRIEEYLATVVPGIENIAVRSYGTKEALQFIQHIAREENLMQFPASSMSDGTLRTLGILVALFQTGGNSLPIPLIGIEEPETALHPAAVAVLLDALEEASLTRQVLITSHSADLLDNKRIDADALLAVASRNGKTEIGPIDKASRSILRDHLFTAGEMLRMSQFTPDTAALPQTAPAPTPTYDENAA